jgi:hypothetical protein
MAWHRSAVWAPWNIFRYVMRFLRVMRRKDGRPVEGVYTTVGSGGQVRVGAMLKRPGTPGALGEEKWFRGTRQTRKELLT